MAKKFLDYDGVSTLWGKIKTWVTNAISTKANIASPTFTGTPAAPTAAAGTNTTQIATTAFVKGAIADAAITVDSALSSTSTNPVQNKVINTALGNKANLASPTFTGTPKAPTAGTSTNNTQIATTAFVQSLISSKISSAYKAAGSLAPSGIVSSLLAAANEGYVYNITGDFTTTADFVEGAGVTYKAGTNIVVINNGTSSSPSYKFDVLGGMTDMSAYLLTDTAKELFFEKAKVGINIPYITPSDGLQVSGFIGDYWWNGAVLKICTASGNGIAPRATYAAVTTQPDCLFLINGDICYYLPTSSSAGTMVNVLEGVDGRGGVVINLDDISAQPTVPTNGDLWWDSQSEMLKQYNNGSWVTIQDDTEHIYVNGDTTTLTSNGGDELEVPDLLIWHDTAFDNIWGFLAQGDDIDKLNSMIAGADNHLSYIEDGISVFIPLSQRIYTSGSVISGGDTDKLNRAHAHGDFAYEASTQSLFKLTQSGTDYVWTAVTAANALFTPSGDVMLNVDGMLYVAYDETAKLVSYFDSIPYVTTADLNTICV